MMEKTMERKEKIQMRREFGLPQGVAVIVGLVIGSGIYIAPTGVLVAVPVAGVALILWAVAGMISTLGALTFAEIGTTIPVAGEKYAYLKVMFGEFPAFLQLWQFFLFVRPAFNMLKCIVFANYIIKPFFPYNEPPETAITLLSIALIALLVYINCVNVRLTAQVQTIFTSMTVITLLVVIGISWVHMAKGNTSFINPSGAFEGADKLTANGIILGLYSAMFPYGGWFALNFLIEELKDPYKNLPRAIVISMTIICGIYILVNIAYLAALGIDGVIASEAVVISFGIVTIGKWTMWVFAVFIALNNIGSLNGGLLVGSRLVFAGARNGHLPRVLGLIHTSYRTPIPAVALQLIIAVFMSIFVNIYSLVNQLISLILLSDVAATAGMIYMRYKYPDMKRPIKLPLIIPIAYATMSFTMLVIALYYAPVQTGMGLLIVLGTALPYYILIVKDIFKIKILKIYSDNILKLVQKTINGLPQSEPISES